MAISTPVLGNQDQDQEPQDLQSTISLEEAPERQIYNRRETLLKDLEQQDTLRIWELKDLSDISTWGQTQKEAALQIQKQIMKDYEEVTQLYNNLLQKSGEDKATYDDDISQLQEVIQTQEQSLAEQATILKYLEKSKGSQSRNGESHQKSTRIPDPPILTDGVEPAYEDWNIKMKMKLEANLDHFPTLALQMGYIQSRLGGKASTHINPCLRSQNKFQSTKEMFEVLDRVFGDPDKCFTAQCAYRKLFQNKDTFATFWAEFQRLTIELDYSEETLIDDLRHKVNLRMQTALIAETSPSSLHALAQKCLLIDQNIQQLQTQEARTVPQGIQQAFKPQDFQSKAKKPTTNPSASSGPLRLYRAPHQNPATERLMQEGRCFLCKQTGHRAYECPTKNVQVHEVNTNDAALLGKE
jgi:hypothetical protein